MFSIPIAYIIISFLVGYFGRNRKLGFWGYFFATLLLTPFIGILLVIVSGRSEK